MIFRPFERPCASKDREANARHLKNMHEREKSTIPRGEKRREASNARMEPGQQVAMAAGTAYLSKVLSR